MCACVCVCVCTPVNQCLKQHTEPASSRARRRKRTNSLSLAHVISRSAQNKVYRERARGKRHPQPPDRPWGDSCVRVCVSERRGCFVRSKTLPCISALFSWFVHSGPSAASSVTLCCCCLSVAPLCALCDPTYPLRTNQAQRDYLIAHPQSVSTHGRAQMVGKVILAR